MSLSDRSLYYREMRKILRYQVEEGKRVRREDGHITFMKDEPEYGRGMVCCLCRQLKKSNKSFSKNRGVCLSCRMRNFEPPWINTDNLVIRTWRGTMTQVDFAAHCGMSQPRLVVVERQPYISLGVARKLLTALVRNAMKGCDLRKLSTDWPFFAMLLPEDVVTWITTTSDKEGSFDLGDEE